MQATEDLKRKIVSTEDLHSVVRTMKALAAVSIRQYEKAVESLIEYSQAIEMGFEIMLKHRPENWSYTGTNPEPVRYGAIIFGSDQGMCGQFNDIIVSYALEKLKKCGAAKGKCSVVAVGSRAMARIEGTGYVVAEQFGLPSGIAGITRTVREILLKIEELREKERLETVLIFHNVPQRGASYKPNQVQLWPVDVEWFHELEKKKWPTRMVPGFTMDWEKMFAALVRNYLFVTIYKSFAESLAAENASRLASMQVAEEKIEDMLDELNTEYQHSRQTAITSELLEILTGFKALMSKKKKEEADHPAE